MKSWNKILSMLLVFALFAGCLVGCVEQGTTPTDPDQTVTDPTGDNGDTTPKPQRPADPGVVPTLPENNTLPENGIIWDMESIPDNLVEEHFAAGKYADQDAFISGNMSFLGVDGKGYEGSRALAVRQNGNYVWADVYTIGYKMDETAHTKWSEEMFWFWYDSTEVPASMMMEMEINGAHMPIGVEYYVMPEGETVAQLAGTLPEGYNGAGYARIPLLGNYRGWIGFSTKAFATDLKKVGSFTYHFTGIVKGTTIYIDNFCLTPANEGPFGAELVKESSNVASSDKPVWDMENLPADLIAGYWASKDHASSVLDANNFQVFSADGRGVNGSKALRFRQKGNYHWADGVTINLKNDGSAVTNWEGGEVLWMYVDTTEMRNNLTMDLWIDNKTPAIGSPIYGINEQTQIVEIGTMPEAYTNAGYGRIFIGAAYKGWVGIPLSAYSGSITNVTNLYFHLGYSKESGNTNCNLYLDELWVLEEGVMPKTATAGNMDALSGKVPGQGGGAEEDDDGGSDNPSAFTPGGMLLWNAESADLNNILSNVPDYDKGNCSHFPHNVEGRGFDGKGYNGSRALGYGITSMESNEYWGNNLILHWEGADWNGEPAHNWVGKEMLWFWVDASEFDKAQSLRVKLDGKSGNGARYFFWDGKNAPVLGGTIADGDPNWGRMPLAADYVGWIGIELDAYVSNGLNLEYVWNIEFYYEPWDEAKMNNTKFLYIDELWLTYKNQVPKI